MTNQHEAGKPLTSKQRQEILERDEYQSQMRHYNEENGWHNNGYCADVDVEPCQNLHVHHIVPRRVGGTNEPDNLITLYQCEHVGVCPAKRIKGGERGGKYARPDQFVVHRDIEEATMNYKGDTDLYKQVFRGRDEMVKEGNLYWNPLHDVEMSETAQERSQNPGWWLGWEAAEDDKTEAENIVIYQPTATDKLKQMNLSDLNSLLFG